MHSDRHKKLRALLVAERKSAALTRTVVAGRPGKPPSYVAKYEGGDRCLDSPSSPDPELALRARLRSELSGAGRCAKDAC
jgi:hypothetical protein